jgi:hypothetical protein
MTEGVHYIRDKASPRGHESEHANTRFLEHLHVNCALSIEHVQADANECHRNNHTSLFSRLSEAGGMRSTQMRWDSAQQQTQNIWHPSKCAKHPIWHFSKCAKPLAGPCSIAATSSLKLRIMMPFIQSPLVVPK